MANFWGPALTALASGLLQGKQQRQGWQAEDAWKQNQLEQAQREYQNQLEQQAFQRDIAQQELGMRGSELDLRRQGFDIEKAQAARAMFIPTAAEAAIIKKYQRTGDITLLGQLSPEARAIAIVAPDERPLALRAGKTPVPAGTVPLPQGLPQLSPLGYRGQTPTQTAPSQDYLTQTPLSEQDLSSLSPEDAKTAAAILSTMETAAKNRRAGELVPAKVPYGVWEDGNLSVKTLDLGYDVPQSIQDDLIRLGISLTTTGSQSLSPLGEANIGVKTAQAQKYNTAADLDKAKTRAIPQAEETRRLNAMTARRRVSILAQATAIAAGNLRVRQLNLTGDLGKDLAAGIGKEIDRLVNTSWTKDKDGNVTYIGDKTNKLTQEEYQTKLDNLRGQYNEALSSEITVSPATGQPVTINIGAPGSPTPGPGVKKGKTVLNQVSYLASRGATPRVILKSLNENRALDWSPAIQSYINALAQRPKGKRVAASISVPFARQVLSVIAADPKYAPQEYDGIVLEVLRKKYGK